jgi:hypothetical protein
MAKLLSFPVKSAERKATAAVFTGRATVPAPTSLTQEERAANTKERLERTYGVGNVDQFSVEQQYEEDDRGIVLFAESNPSSEVAAAFRRIAASLQRRVDNGRTLWSCDTARALGIGEYPKSRMKKQMDALVGDGKLSRRRGCGWEYSAKDVQAYALHLAQQFEQTASEPVDTPALEVDSMSSCDREQTEGTESSPLTHPKQDRERSPRSSGSLLCVHARRGNRSIQISFVPGTPGTPR